MKNPLVSVIIVNYNGAELLKNCIGSILQNDFSNFEIIVADNASTDNSINRVKKTYSKHLDQIKFLKLTQNFGPAKARNDAVNIASGQYISFLDNDTQVAPDWISQALTILKHHPDIGAIQCKLLLLQDKRKYDYAGEYIGNLGFIKSIANYGEIDNGQYDTIQEILAAKSAGMFVRKDVFLQLGGFDPDYFIFLEETDLGWRIRLRGFRIIYCPKSIVYHCFSSSKNIVSPAFNNYLVRFHGAKNYILTLYKNLSFGYLLMILPIHILLWFLLATYLLITGKLRSSVNIYQAILWNFINIKSSYLKRKLIQNNRKVSDNYLFNSLKLMKYTSFTYYLLKFFDSQKAVSTPENSK
jgi:GT2 family glycosyltransferase